MNWDRPAHGSCPLTDEVVAHVLDGDCGPVAAQDELRAHLEACPRCRQALAMQRRIDAMIASRTSTEVDEATADRLLAFLHAPAALAPDGGVSSMAFSARASRARRASLALVALAVAASLALLLWGASGAVELEGDAPRVPAAAHREDAAETCLRAPDRGALSSTTSLALPAGFRIERPTARAAATRNEWLRAFRGDYVRGLSRKALGDRARQLFVAATYCTPPTKSCVDLLVYEASAARVADHGPHDLHFDSDFRMAALRWYLENSVVLHPRDARRDQATEWAAFVLDLRGSERRRAVDELRARVGDDLEALPTQHRADLAGALGLRLGAKRLRAMHGSFALRYLVAAAITGDEPCLDAILDFCVGLARYRSKDLLPLAQEVIDSLPRSVHARLCDRAATFIASLRRQPDRFALRDLFAGPPSESLRSESLRSD